MEIVLTNRETDVMQVLWDQGPSVVAEVRDKLADDLAYTTVLTILRTLESKGFVGHNAEGRAHRYFAQVGQQAAQNSAIQQLKRRFFNGSVELLFTRLVSDQKMTADQVRGLRKLLKTKPG